MTYRDFLRCFVVAGGILILVPLGVAQNPGLQLSSSSLTFTGFANGPKLPMQAVTVTSVSSSAIDFAVLMDGGAPGSPAPAWLSVTPLLATTPVQIRVVADPSTLAAGTYPARIQLTDRQGRSLGVIIPVTLQANAGTPQFDVTPPAVNFSGSPAAGNLQQGILVRSLGPGSLSPISASIVSGYAGLYATVDPCDTVCIVHVTSAISTLSSGAHNGIVRITTAAGSKPMDVPVSLFAADHGPFDQLSPTAVSFEAIQVSGLSDSRTVSLINSGDSLSTWSADITDGAQWLSISPASGTTAAGKTTTLTASLNLGNQPPGNYGGMIRISSPDPGAVTLYLPVILKVGVSGTSPIPLLSTGGLVLTTPTGAIESVQQQINLLAASTTPVNFQVSPQGSSWLSLVPSRGQASSTPMALTISAAPNNLAQGFYSGLINVGFGTSSVRTLHVGFSVVPTQVGICQPQTLYLTETAIPDNFAVSAGSPTPLEAVLVDDCGTPIVNGTVTATFSNGDPGVDLLGIGNGHYVQTWTPVNPSDSLPGGNLSVALQGFAPPLAAASTEVIGTVAKDSLPAIATNGVINSFIAARGLPIAPGAVVQIYGSRLASGTAFGTITNGRLSTAVAGASVKIGGIDAPIAYASPTQINVQVPSELQANRQYQVIVNTSGVYSKPEPINTIAAQPVLAAFADGRIIAQDVNYNLINAQNPAHAGDVITLYLTGMGATTPPVASGTLAPTSPLATTVLQPQVSIDTTSADILFSGLTPGGVGLYQINIRIPAGIRTGDLQLVVSQSGITSNTAIIPVR
jgi:uncharacterized protein (TIGR03437 family)